MKDVLGTVSISGSFDLLCVKMSYSISDVKKQVEVFKTTDSHCSVITLPF